MNITNINSHSGPLADRAKWEHWVKHYSEKRAIVSSLPIGWSGRGSSPTSPRFYHLRELSDKEVVNHYEQIIRKLETPPLIIGHGVGRINNPDSS